MKKNAAKKPKLGCGYIPKTLGYAAVTIEAVYPDGEVSIRNAFMNENAACEAGDPAWPREKLVNLAFTTASRWNEAYSWHPAKLRVVQ